MWLVDIAFGLFYNNNHYLLQTPKQGADNSIYVALSQELEGTGGRYFVNCHSTQSSDESYREDVQKRLWEISCKLTGVSWGLVIPWDTHKNNNKKWLKQSWFDNPASFLIAIMIIMIYLKLLQREWWNGGSAWQTQKKTSINRKAIDIIMTIFNFYGHKN